MKIINEDIKNNDYKSCYLLFGKERYLVTSYRDRLKNALVPPDDTINFNAFEGKGTDVDELISLGSTMPFFADRRVIFADDTGLFKGSGDAASKLASWIAEMPDTTVVVFSEQEADKRSVLYKAVSEKGYASEMNGPTEEELLRFIGGKLKRSGLQIKNDDASYLLESVGSDMANLSNELEKLIGFCLGRTSVARSDIDAVCIKQITGRIFDLTDALAEKNRQKAMKAYMTMLELHERPAGIIYRITSNFNSMLQVKDLYLKGRNSREIAAELGIKQYPADKYCKQCRHFTEESLKNAVRKGLEYETAFKQGDMDEEIAAEMYIVSLFEDEGKR